MRILGVFMAECIVTGFNPAASPSQAKEESKQRDPFAELAARQADYAEERLAPVEPPKLARKFLPLAAEAAARPSSRRKKSPRPNNCARSFSVSANCTAVLEGFGPAAGEERIRMPLESFDWRMETEDDRRDFAATLAGQGTWQRVKIPALWRADGPGRHLLSHGVRGHAGDARKRRAVRQFRGRLQGPRFCQRGAISDRTRDFRPLRVRVHAARPVGQERVAGEGGQRLHHAGQQRADGLHA